MVHVVLKGTSTVNAPVKLDVRKRYVWC